MTERRLLLNDAKTEFLVLGTRQQLKKLHPSTVEVGNHIVNPSSSTRNLGVIFDSSLNLNNHINQICKASFFYIHNIRRISKYLSKDSRRTLVHAYVTARLDYCNSILYGLPKYLLAKLQRIQNTAASLITDTKKYESISRTLFEFHWLPVHYRIRFKILAIPFKAIYGMAPRYLSNLVSVK